MFYETKTHGRQTSVGLISVFLEQHKLLGEFREFVKQEAGEKVVIL